MGLSPAAIETLQSVKRILLERRREKGFTALSVEQICELGAAQRELDSKRYAEWAGEKAFEHYGAETVIHADLWVKKRLRRGYLVPAEWLEHSYQTALSLAKKEKR